MDANRRLQAWRESQDLSCDDAAALVGVSGVAWRQWERGPDRPRAAMRDAVEIATGIPSSAWETPTERAYLDAVRRRVSERAAGKSSSP